jgi:hypothetical protein
MRPDGDGLVNFWKDGSEWVVAPGAPLSPRTFHATREGALAAIRSALGAARHADNGPHHASQLAQCGFLLVVGKHTE